MSEERLQIKLSLDNSEAKAGSRDLKTQVKRDEAEMAEDATRAERKKAEEAKRGGRERLDAEEQVKKGLKGSSDAGVQGFNKMAAASAVFQVGLSKLVDLAGKVGQALTDAGEKQKRLTAAFGDRRDQLGELATLMGKQADNAFTLDVAKFNAKTGMKKDEGVQFLTELYNSGAQFEGKNITSKEFKEYGEKTGQLATARQIDPAVVGDVAGSVLGFTDYNKFGDKAAEQALGKVNSALATLGRGKGRNNVLANQFGMLASSSLNEDALKGTFTDSDEVAAVISVAAEKHDAQAAELAKIAGRAIRGYDKDQGELLKRAGVKPGDSFIASMEKINAVAQEEVAKRQETTPGFKTEDFLRENFKDEGAIDALNVFLNKGVAGGGFKDRMAFAKENSGEAPAENLIAEAMKGDRFRERQADANLQLSEAKKGAKNSSLEIVRKQVLAELIDKGEIDTDKTNIKDYLVGSTSFGLLGSGEQVRIDEATQRKLIERNGGKDDQSWSDYLNFSPTDRDADLNSRMERMRSRGIDPLLDAGGPAAVTPSMESGTTSAANAEGSGIDSKEVIGVLKEMRDELKRKNGDRDPATPPAPAVRFGAAPEAQANR